MDDYHFIGIGGIGMSALARILLQRGVHVSGSDKNASVITEELKQLGAEIFIGHSASLISRPVTVVYNSDIPLENPEYVEAKKRGYQIWHRSDLLKKLMEGSSPLLVSGTHGKTTSSSLLAHTLVKVGLDPSYAIGGIVRSLGSNGGAGKGTYFVAEADESDGTFLKYASFGAILTNIDNDHLNFWQTEERLEKGFKQFASQVSSTDHLFFCGDDERLKALKIKGVSYGFDEGAELQVTCYRQEAWKNIFDIHFDGVDYIDIEIPMIGGHNVLNAAAVFGLSLRLGVNEAAIRSALKSFEGVGRRAEMKGECKEIAIYDDYAHHPTEIFATLRAIKTAIGQRRLVVAFQPHRYTRTKDCMDLFAEAFEHADLLLLTDIYSAGEKPLPGVNTEALLKKLQGRCHAEIYYHARPELAHFASTILRPKDVFVTMGAGDITKLGPELLEQLKS